VLREEIVMYSDYNESTRRFRNREELKTSGINKEKLHMEKEVVAISVAASMLWLVGSARGKNACMFASVVGDVVA
jgi:hypothetical protein